MKWLTRPITEGTVTGEMKEWSATLNTMLTMLRAFKSDTGDGMTLPSFIASLVVQ